MKETKSQTETGEASLVGRVRDALANRIDLISSRFIDIKECRSVCLALGPYRNLTTLTAATIFLHPNCQVLNHAGPRIFGNPRLDFLSEYSKERLDRFVQFGIKLSTGGTRGAYGGSITHSHAYDDRYKMKELHSRAGAALLKRHIHCLFWKESLLTANLIRRRKTDLEAIFKAESRLRFLLPIRNPMDCAISNLRTGHVSKFETLPPNPSQVDVLKGVLNEIFWVAELKQRNPTRFFYYFEHEVSREMLTRLARFLDVDPVDEWITNALAAMKIESSYEHSPELVQAFEAGVAREEKRFPEFCNQLRLFLRVKGTAPTAS